MALARYNNGAKISTNSPGGSRPESASASSSLSQWSQAVFRIAAAAASKEGRKEGSKEGLPAVPRLPRLKIHQESQPPLLPPSSQLRTRTAWSSRKSLAGRSSADSCGVRTGLFAPSSVSVMIFTLLQPVADSASRLDPLR